MPSTSDHLLIEASLLGDKKAFELLYTRHRQAIYAYALALVQDPDAAESVTTDTFVTAWHKRAEIAREVRQIREWLLKTASNNSKNANRRAGRRMQTVDIIEYEQIPVESDPTDAQFDTQDLLHRIGEEVRNMPPGDAALFRALILEERPQEEIAAALGISVAAVKMRMKRIRGRLRDKFPGERA